MKKEIREFYNSQGLETKKLIRRSKGLQRPQIEIGMKKVYRRLQDGESIPNSKIAREVWKEAEIAHSQKLKDEDLELEEEKIRQLTIERNDYKEKFYAVLIACAVLSLTAVAWLIEGAF